MYQITPDLNQIIADIERAEKRVQSAFFEDLFMAISQMEGVQPRNQLEIAERKGEKMLMLGPPLGRVNNELLGVAIERVFGIMHRSGLLPPAPDSIAGHNLGVEFTSDLARAQKSADTTAIERTFQFAGTIAALKPEVMDNLDADKAVTDYADMIGTQSDIIVDPAVVAQTRQQRQQMQQMQASLNTGMAAAQGAETLSKTDVGGGVNALQRMTGQG